MPLLAKDRRGIAAVEMALVAPVLALLMLGTHDFVQYQRTRYRLESMAMQMAQVVSQCNKVTAEDLNRFWDEAGRIGGSLVQLSGSGATLIISAVHNNNNTNRIAWQRRTGNSGLGSTIGAEGGTATLPNNAKVEDGTTLFVVETAARVTAWVESARHKLMNARPPDTLRGAGIVVSRSIDQLPLQKPPSAETVPACMS